MASLGWVIPGAATEGVTPLFFSLKTWRPFFAHRCHYLYRCLLLSLGCHPPRGCHPTPFLPVRPCFSTILCKFAHKKFFSFGCHPLEGVTRAVPPHPLVTPLVVVVVVVLDRDHPVEDQFKMFAVYAVYLQLTSSSTNSRS